MDAHKNVTERFPVSLQLQGRIAFVSDRDGTNQIYVMNADGSGLTKLTRDAAPYSQLAWSPDGAKIAFVTGQGIFVMNADGSGVTRLAVEGFGPTWSVDGTKIRFAKYVGDSLTEIDEVTLDGSETTKLSTGAFGDNWISWSPDRNKAAVESATMIFGDPLWQVYVINADGTGLHRLTSQQGIQCAESAAAWSPDGGRIVFWNYCLGVATMRADGSGSPTSLFNDPSVGFYSSLTWSPDAKFIAFTRGREIWVTDSGAIDPPRRFGATGVLGWNLAWTAR